MRTTLDERMDAAVAALTAPAGPLPLGTVRRFGRDLPCIAAAPPTLPACFAHFCAAHDDRTFLVAGTERLSFGQVYDAATRVAHALVDGFGVAPGDRVAIAARNSPAWIVLYMGIAMAGGVATLLNGWWQRDELAAAVAEVDARLIFADPPRAARLAALGVAVHAFVDDLPLEAALDAVLARAPRGAGGAGLPVVAMDDPATILFTSGSTGRARGALSTHFQVMQGVFNFLSSALMMQAIAAQDGRIATLQPATLLNVPLFHVTAEVPVFLQSFPLGRKLVVMPRWDAEEAMRLIEREQATYFVGVPLMSFELLTHPRRDDYDLSTLTDISAGGAPRPVDHVRRIAAEMQGAPLIGYGLTETNATGAGNWRANYLAKPASVGRPSPPLVDIAILDDAGAGVAAGVMGEVGVRAAACFDGYWGRPADTAAAFTPDGFFRTGDLGYLDPDGYLFIVDRKKDIIIRGGENIGCPEVEAALYAHPAVVEAAVFGLDDERFGEVPGAVVHLSAPVSADELLAFVAGRLAAFKVPHRLWISADPLPRLGTEKVDKLAVRHMYRHRADPSPHP